MHSNAYSQYLERSSSDEEKLIIRKILEHGDASSSEQFEEKDCKWPRTIMDYYAKLINTPHLQEMTFKECLKILDSDHGTFEKFLDSCSDQLGEQYCAKLPIQLYKAEHFNAAKQLLLKRQKNIKGIEKRERVVIMTFLIDEIRMKFPAVDLQNLFGDGEAWEIDEKQEEKLNDTTGKAGRKRKRHPEEQTHYDFYVAEKKNRGFEFGKYQLETNTGMISECPIRVASVKGPKFKPISLEFIPQIFKLHFLRFPGLSKGKFPQWNEWVSASEESIKKEEEEHESDKQKRRKLSCINCSARVGLFFHFRKFQEHSTRSCFKCYKHKDDFVNHLIKTVNSVLTRTYGVQTWENEKREKNGSRKRQREVEEWEPSSDTPGCSQPKTAAIFNQGRTDTSIDFNYHLQDLCLPEDFSTHCDDLLLPEEFERLNRPTHPWI